MSRIAKCHCGGLEVECDGDPAEVIMCHCELCQRRTGASYNLAAWYSSENTEVRGDSGLYVRTGDTGKEIQFHFCRVCGTSVFWDLTGDRAGTRAVAIGCFSDPDFPAPTISIFGRNRHKWLNKLSGVTSLTGFLGSDPEAE